VMLWDFAGLTRLQIWDIVVAEIVGARPISFAHFTKTSNLEACSLLSMLAWSFTLNKKVIN